MSDNWNKETEAAQSLGMDASRLQNAWNLVDREIEGGAIPGAVAVVCRNGLTAEYAAGLSVDAAGVRCQANIDTVYDCASVTKVTVTLPLVLMLLDRGLLSLDDPVTKWLPEFAANGKEKATVKHLLTHTSGLKTFPHSSFPPNSTPDEIISFICTQPKHYEPGAGYLYTCFGYILLGRIASQIWGVPLDLAAEEQLFRPLGMTSSRYNPPLEWKPRIAATEYDEQIGRNDWGNVHDEIALALGGVSGNAGLFSTAHDLTRYAQMWLARGKAGSRTILSQAAVEAAVRTHTPHIPHSNRGLGWVLKGDVKDASGDLLSLSSYGHTGYTGTSLYIDPVRNLSVVLLTNRVHYGRDKSVDGLRARFHNAIVAAIVD